MSRCVAEEFDNHDIGLANNWLRQFEPADLLGQLGAVPVHDLQPVVLAASRTGVPVRLNVEHNEGELHQGPGAHGDLLLVLWAVQANVVWVVSWMVGGRNFKLSNRILTIHPVDDLNVKF